MGTRSVIAIPTETGWKGRYVHWDGYPEHMVPEYLRLVAEKGVERCIDVLINWNAGWSSITSNPVIDGMTNDGRFKAVSDYGIAYTTKKMNFFGQPDYQQASFADWQTSEDTESWCEYAYVLHPDVLEVWENVEGGWKHHSTVRYDSKVFLDAEKNVRDLPTSILV